MNNILRALFATFLLGSLVACSSSGPATRYYALSPVSHSVSSDANASSAYGIVPIILPEYLDTSSIVSRESSVALNLSGGHAWAESLDKGVNRVLAANLSHYLSAGVASFPWDQRDRPEKQLRIVVESFEGKRGAQVTLSASWSLYDISEKSLLKKGRLSLEKSSSDNYPDYVATLNALLNEFSEQLAQALQE